MLNVYVFVMCMRTKRVALLKMRFNRLVVGVLKRYADCLCFRVSRKSCCSNYEAVLRLGNIRCLLPKEPLPSKVPRVGAGSQTLIVHIHSRYIPKA